MSETVMHAHAHARRGERGAALVTTLLISLLVLGVGGALILTSAMATTTSIEAAHESQAYTAAEAGIQASLNALRGGVQPNPSPTPVPSATPAVAPAVADHLKISFRRAVTRYYSNHPADPNTLGMRLSRWLPYNYTPIGGTFPDRVGLSNPYSPLTGMAYSVTVEDPDQSHRVTYSTAGRFRYNGTAGGPVATNNADGSCSVVFPTPTAASRVTITYAPQASTPLADASGGINSGMGRFTVSKVGPNTVNVPEGIRFELAITQSLVWAGTSRFNATLIDGRQFTNAGTNAVMQFDYSSLTVYGARYNLLNLSTTHPQRSLDIVYAAGASASTVTNVNAQITAPEPLRLVIRSIGYGPRGAQKRLAVVVKRARFDLEPPAPIVIRGADPIGSSTPLPMTFDLGDSASKGYSGADAAAVDGQKPTVAISLYDWQAGNGGIRKEETVAEPQLSVLDINAIPSPWPSATPLTPVPGTGSPAVTIPDAARTPDFLRTANAARAFLIEMESLARGTDVTAARPNGRYFTSAQFNTTLAGMAGDNDPYDPQITFVDGNATLDGGAGLLIVTGRLTLNGNNDFKGIIIVMGTGEVERSGAGNGNVEGSWLVAKFSRDPTVANPNFLPPIFDVDGGGNGQFIFNSKQIRDANNLVGGRVLSFSEY